jgi:hypothetical protein
MKTKLYVTSKISRVRYMCGYCHQITDYETDGLPTVGQCHSCLKKLEWEVINI